MTKEIKTGEENKNLLFYDMVFIKMAEELKSKYDRTTAKRFNDLLRLLNGFGLVGFNLSFMTHELNTKDQSEYMQLRRILNDCPLLLKVSNDYRFIENVFN
jgi:hypothetical protein